MPIFNLHRNRSYNNWLPNNINQPFNQIFYGSPLIVIISEEYLCNNTVLLDRLTTTPHIAIAMRWTKFMGKYILNHWVLQDIIYFCVVLETTNCSLDNFLSRYLCKQHVKKVNWDNKSNKRHIGGSSLFMHVITKNINGKNIMMNSISSNTFLNVISWDTSDLIYLR